MAVICICKCQQELYIQRWPYCYNCDFFKIQEDYLLQILLFSMDYRCFIAPIQLSLYCIIWIIFNTYRTEEN